MHAGSAPDNHVTSGTFDLEVNAEVPPQSTCVLPSLVLIAQVVFLLERGHTRTDADDHLTDASATAAWATTQGNGTSQILLPAHLAHLHKCLGAGQGRTQPNQYHAAGG